MPEIHRYCRFETVEKYYDSFSNCVTTIWLYHYSDGTIEKLKFKERIQ